MPLKIYTFLYRYFASLFTAIFAFTFGIFKQSHRDLIHKIYFHFKQNTTHETEKTIPEVSFSEIFPSPPEVTIFEPDSQNGNVSLFELLVLNNFAKTQNPQKIFEIGTFDGRTTLNLAANSPSDTQVFTLDLPREKMDETLLPVEEKEKIHIDKDTSGTRFQNHSLSKKITQLYGDSANFDFESYWNKMDLIFVDGSHSYPYVVKDTETALKLLRSKTGIIIWHDYGVFEGVTKALNEFYEKDMKGLKHISGTSLVILSRT